MGLKAQTPTKEATLTLLLKQGQSTASKLAAAMQISVQAMRRHLRCLKGEGLVQATQISQGPGRPLNVWQLTSLGQAQFNSGTQNLTLDLFSSIESNFSPETLNTLLSNLTIKKASVYRKEIGPGAINERLKKLV